MADDEDSPPPSPPPLPSSPPPSASIAESHDDTTFGASKFKALQQMLASTPSMYTRGGGRQTPPAPPPKRQHVQVQEEPAVESSPRLAHHTRDRPRRKTRVPSRGTLREKALSQSSDVFDTTPTEISSSPVAAGAPPLEDGLASSSLHDELEQEDVFLPSSPPPSPSPSPPPSPPPLSSFPLTFPPSETDLEQKTDISKDRDTPRTEMNISPNTPSPKSHSKPESFPSPSQPTPSVGGASLVSPDTDRAPVKTATSASSFTSRLRQIRESRAQKTAQRRSPTPTSLSPPDSTSSLPQLKPVPEPVVGETSHESVEPSVSQHSLGVSSVSSSTSLSTSDKQGPPQEQSMPHVLEEPKVPLVQGEPPVAQSELDSQQKQKVGLRSAPEFNLETAQQTVSDMEVESSSSSSPPSLPPSPPPSPPPIPPTLPPESSPMPTPKLSSTHTAPDTTSALTPAASSPKPGTRANRAAAHTNWEEKRRSLDRLLSEPLPLLGSKSEGPSGGGAASVVEVEGDMDESRAAELHSSSESLPSLPESPPPELPMSPPPPISASFSVEDDQLAMSTSPALPSPTHPSTLLPTSPPSSSPPSTSSLPSSDHKPLPPDARGVGGTAPALSSSETESSTPDHTSGKSSPQPAQPVQLRHPKPHRSSHYRPERRSAFDAMIVSESSTNEMSRKRLSVAERRAMTLQASRRPDGDTKPVLKRWSDTSMLSEGNQKLTDSTTVRTLTSSTTAGSVYQFRSNQSQSGSNLRATDMKTRSLHREQSMPAAADMYPVGVRAISEGEAAMHSPETKITRVARMRWGKQENVSDDSPSISTSDLPSTSQNRSQDSLDTMSYSSSQDTEEAGEGRRATTTPLLSATHSAGDTDKGRRLGDMDEQDHAQVKDQEGRDEGGGGGSTVSSTHAVLSGVHVSGSHGEEEVDGGSSGRESVSSKDTVETPPPTSGKRKPLRSVNSLIAEASLHRHALEAELDGPVSSQLISLEQLHREHNQILETRMAEIKEQQLLSKELLQATSEEKPSPHKHTPTHLEGNYPREEEEGEEEEGEEGEEEEEEEEGEEEGEEEEEQDMSMTGEGEGKEEVDWETLSIERDDLEDDPQSWSVEQVCHWLELVGLGTYRDAFRERNIDGALLLTMDIQLFAELGVDSPEIRELFLSKIYELNNPSSNMGNMQDDFLLSVDSYTPQDWKKLQAAVDALKSPTLRDDIELEPSAIGQYLHTDYVRSLSTPNIYDLKSDAPYSESDLSSPLHSVPHSSTVHSFPNYALVGPAAATDQMPRKVRVPSSRSLKRQRISSMAQAGDRFEYITSRPAARRGSSVSSTQDSPLVQRKGSATDTPLAAVGKSGSPGKEDVPEPEPGKKRKGKKEKVSKKAKSPQATDAVRLAKNLQQGVIVYEDGQYKETRSRSLEKQSTLEAMSPAYWEQSDSDPVTGLVRLFMEEIQEGTYYKAFLATSSTSVGELVKQALEKANISDDPDHYCIWQVAIIPGATSRVLQASEHPLSLQLEWPHFNSHHFELKLCENIHKVKFALELPLCDQAEIDMTLPASATATEAVRAVLARLSLTEPYREQGIQCAIMDITSRTRVARALGEKECPVSLQSTGHKMKLVSLSGAHKRQSVGQTDKALLVHVRALEQEKAMLLEQLQSAQVMLQKHLEPAAVQSSGDGKREDDDQHEHGQKAQPQVLALQKTIDALKRTSQQQQEMASHSIEELQSQVAQLRTEGAEREEEMAALRRKMERALRDQQAKDSLLASLQAQLQYKSGSLSSTGDPTPGQGESEPGSVRDLQASLAAHEKALTSLRTEYHKQASELAQLEEEGRRLRAQLRAKEEQRQSSSLSQSPSVIEAGDEPDGEGAVGSAGEMMIDRLRKLNASLNRQLQRQNDKIEQQRRENQRLEEEVLAHSNVGKEKVLEVGLLQTTVKALKEQLAESESAHEKLSQALRAVEQNQHDHQLKALETSLRHKEQEITRLKNVDGERTSRLKAVEQERDRAVKAVRQYVIHSVAEEEDLEEGSQQQSSQADLLKAYQRVNKELQKHKLYLDQLLTIVIDSNPEILSLVAEAQKRRDIVDSESWC